MGWFKRLGAIVSTAKTVAESAAEERELAIPESMINSAAERWVVTGPLASLVARMHDGSMRLDALLDFEGTTLKVAGDFTLKDICINSQLQFITLRQKGPLGVLAISHSSRRMKLLFAVLWPWRHWLAAYALKHVLRKLDGVTIAGSTYHFDLSPWLTRDPKLITAINTINVSRGRFGDGALILSGSVNLMGLLS